MPNSEITQLKTLFEQQSTEAVLKDFLGRYRTKIALASSLGAEDQVLTDMVLKLYPQMRIFVIDTGRLPQETYALISATMQKYRMNYEIYFPRTADVEALVSRNGPNLFYESYEKRKQCCEIRKVRPLRRVLETVEVWITGLRREQAVTRNDLELIEWDEVHQKIKLNPLLDWSTQQVWNYLREHQVPYNPLHDQNYPSIGCAPCTRAVKPGEALRAGRWWWEEPEHKECGLHYRDGKLVRRCQE